MISPGNVDPVAMAEHVPEAADDIALPALLLEVRERLRQRLLGGQVREGQPHRLLRVQPNSASAPSAMNRNRPSASAAVDDVGRRLDELAEAGLRLAELALEAVALAHVADRAVGAGEPSVLAEPGRGDELGRHRLAVRALDVDPAADLLRARGHAGREVVLGDVPRRAVDQRPEVLAEEARRPAGRSAARRRPTGR